MFSLPPTRLLPRVYVDPDTQCAGVFLHQAHPRNIEGAGEMATTVWGETYPRPQRRRRRNSPTRTSQIPYSITATGRRCAITRHTHGTLHLPYFTPSLPPGPHTLC